MKLPKARTENLVEQDTDTELLIYDLKTNKAYVLNETSKAIYKACNDQIEHDELKSRSNFSDEVIYFALDELNRNELLADANYVSPFSGMNRREVIKKVGLASMVALPIIAGLTAPTAAGAASNCPNPGGSNIPSGCPVGVSFLSGGSCASRTDADRNSNCDIFYGGNCQSGDAVYRQGSCTNEGGNNRTSCNCA